MTVQTDMRELMALPAFRKFMWRLIQQAGILTPGTNGTAGRDLNYVEGRRSLGFDALRDAEQGLPPEGQSPSCTMTLTAILREAAQPEKDERNERRDDND